VDEIYQRSVPGRVSDIRDWATDTAALLAAVLFTLFVSAWAQGRRRGGADASAEARAAKEPVR
jgi:VanZ family protein